MYWLGLLFPDLALEALGGDPSRHYALGRHGPRAWALTACGAVAAGMPLAQARLLAPEALPLPRHPAAERALLDGRAALAYGFGAPVVRAVIEHSEPGNLPRFCVWVEVGASVRLFGGMTALLERVRNVLREAGLVARLGLAPSRSAAALLAFVGDARPVTSLQRLAERLDPLPLDSPPWPAAWHQALAGLGLRRLGELRQMPRAGLLARFGAELLQALDRLYGQAPEPFAAFEPPVGFDLRLELTEEIAHVEALAFPLQRLAGELQAYLAGRDLDLVALRLELELAWGPAVALDWRFLEPVRRRERLLAPLREWLLQHPPAAPVRALRLIARECAPPRPDQVDAFAEGRQSREWAATLERLRARLGEGALWTPVLHDTHAPRAAHGQGLPGAESPVTAPASPRPLWLCPEPRPLPQPPRLEQPERIASGWWSGQADEADYGWVEIGGRRAWVRRSVSGDPLGDQAFVEGWAG